MLRIETLSALTDLPAGPWNALLAGDDDPFTRHEFLSALERHGCVGAGTGWLPQHLLLLDGAGQLLGAVPMYAKAHSWGEFVFDWSWAQAHERAGIDYYPKLLGAVPFTPTTGPRLLVAPGSDAAAIRARLAAALPRLATELGVSGVHLNYLGDADRDALAAEGFLARRDCRFLWHNRGYADFEDYLQRFRADKRKKARRERRRIAEAGIVFRTLAGEAMDDADWQLAFAFSERTFRAHGNDHYLNCAFLADVARRMPGRVIVKLAERGDEALGCAIYFRGRERLYGRYWGALHYEDALHFEACYYQGIEYCIAEGLAEFDPGTQGEHKLARGFEPTFTHSAHWLADPRFRVAIGRYLERERAAVDEYVAAAARHLPFHREPVPA
jgi:predicted N-acyltransferase